MTLVMDLFLASRKGFWKCFFQKSVRKRVIPLQHRCIISVISLAVFVCHTKVQFFANMWRNDLFHQGRLNHPEQLVKEMFGSTSKVSVSIASATSLKISMVSLAYRPVPGKVCQQGIPTGQIGSNSQCFHQTIINNISISFCWSWSWPCRVLVWEPLLSVIQLCFGIVCYLPYFCF